jgi:hypothetical protein
MTQQTSTPLSLLTLPSKDALCREFVGKKLSTLRTPALIVDKSKFKRNCEVEMEWTVREEGGRNRTDIQHIKLSKGFDYR